MKLKPHFKYFLIVGLITGTLYFLIYRSFKKDSSPQMKQKIEALASWEQIGAPDIKLSDSQSMRELSKNIFIVHFWASWCGPCIEELPSLVNLARSFPNDLLITAVSLDSSAEEMHLFIKDQKIQPPNNFILIHDKDHNLRKSYLITKIPESFILDKSLKLKKRIVGNIDWVTQESLVFFQSLMSKSSHSN